MKNFIVKISLTLPAILFAFYLSMVLVGCGAQIINCNDNFYCGAFCLIGKILGGLAVILFFFSILPDIKAFLNIPKHAAPSKK
jgi:hypothetical protein